MKKGKKLQYMILTVFAMLFCIGIYASEVKAAEPVSVEIPVEQNRCAMACQGCGAVFYFF